MNQESDTAQHKPVLNQEGFQQLLAAAYLLQIHHDRQASIHQLSESHARSLSVLKIVQKRPPSVMIRDRQLQEGQPNAIVGNKTAEPLCPARLVPFAEPWIRQRMKVSLRRRVWWRTVEPLAIAIVFCMMMGLSIHRVSAVPSRTSLASEMLDEQNERARPTERVTASSPPVVGRESHQSSSGDEADIVAEDIVIHYPKHLVNPKPGVPLIFGPDAAAATVVQYGSDVKMWSRKPVKATPNRLEH